MPDLIGGRYRVQQAIGQGGMGTVWLCRDETLRRDVAVKQVGLLPGESVTDSARAFREARSSAGLNHRNVVTVFDVVEEAGAIWLVMEHVPGRSLSAIIKEDGPLSPEQVADIGAQVAEGLAAAHSAGITHRDVKPGNVLIRHDGVAKISDFGIARTHGDPALTQSGFLTGTPSYFAPEIARGGEPGQAADVWALGATLYAAVEGRPPYEPRPNPVAVLHDITSGQPRTPHRAAFLEPALARMMDRDPSSRWSMDDTAHSLGRLKGANETRTRENTAGAAATTYFERPAPEPEPARDEVRPAPAPPPSDDRGSNGRRSRRGLYGVLGALALLLVLAGIAYLSSQRNDDPNDTAGGAASDTPSQTPSRSPSKSQSPSDTPSETASDTPSETPSESASAAPAGAAAEKEQLLRDYFAAAPGGTDEAWEMLGPGLQAQGRNSYDNFWRGIRSVDVLSAQATDDSDTVRATLRYTSTNGRVSTERKLLGLVEDGDGGYLIDSDRQG